MADKLRVLSLFAGIGGFDLGLERTGGFETVAFCENDPFCRRVIAKHWPEVPCYDDVRTLTAEWLAADGIAVDVICGGFPCQDISTAGNGAGLAGERSGLWREYSRLIRELRPRYVIVENVSALLSRGLGEVLGELAAIRYDAEWHCVPASAVGAPHQRDRIWIVANACGGRCGGPQGGEMEQSLRTETFGRSEIVADAFRLGQSGPGQSGNAGDPTPCVTRQAIDAVYGRIRNEWGAEPDVGRVANGVPNRMDRLRALGNAVVPQIPEMIGRIILNDDRSR